MDTVSYWSATHAFPDFPAIDRDIEVDVVVVGAGLTGITTAYLLKQAGAQVACSNGTRSPLVTPAVPPHI